MNTRVTTERHGPVLAIGLNRPEKRNAADLAMLEQLALAYGELERDRELRAAVVFAHGDHFTAGLDLADIAPRIGDDGISLVPAGGIDPWQLQGPQRTKPVVMAVQGTCLTLGIELILASEMTVAATNTRFGQIEVARGILPFGGATVRFPQAVGWGTAMRWMLTGDTFDAAEAHRMGLVQELVAPEQVRDRALELAKTIARMAPLAVQATLANARRALTDPAGAVGALQSELVALSRSTDARIGMEAFLSREPAQFIGE